ncbi:hypothetical protein JHW43_009592 [Diplocarpon mali]|nr:hypothetical protein JHW43_009592 [Diplocarpon mali]
MYWSSAIAVVALSAGSVQATSRCFADNCLRAVIASSQKPFASSALKDCLSALVTTVTVTPTPVTSLVRVTQTAASVTVTRTISASTVVSTTVSQTSYQTSTQVISTTRTSSVSFTITQTVNPVVTATTYASVTTTVTSVVPCGGTKKRFVKLARNGEEKKLVWFTKPGLLVQPATRRAVETPLAYPSYASACSGTARYSSACSCLGLTLKTTTTTAIASTKTSTAYATTTPTTTTLVTQVSSSAVTVTTTIVVLVTTSTTSTSVSVVSVPVTVTSAIPIATLVTQTVTVGVTATSTAAGCATTCPADSSYLIEEFCYDGSSCDITPVCEIFPNMDACFARCGGPCLGASYDESTLYCNIFNDCCT